MHEFCSFLCCCFHATAGAKLPSNCLLFSWMYVVRQYDFVPEELAEPLIVFLTHVVRVCWTRVQRDSPSSQVL